MQNASLFSTKFLVFNTKFIILNTLVWMARVLLLVRAFSEQGAITSSMSVGNGRDVREI